MTEEQIALALAFAPEAEGVGVLIRISERRRAARRLQKMTAAQIPLDFQAGDEVVAATAAPTPVPSPRPTASPTPQRVVAHVVGAIPVTPQIVRAAPSGPSDLLTRVLALTVGHRVVVEKVRRDFLEIERSSTRYVVICRGQHAEWWREAFHTAGGALRYAQAEARSLRTKVA